MKKQTGFVLVSVLIITTITTMLALSQINENRLQERIGGHQQKELNARLAAEKGIFAAFTTIDDGNKAGDTNDLILSYLQNLSVSGENYSFDTLNLDSATHTFTVISKGDVQGATAYLKAQIQAREEVGTSLFEDAVTGCDGVVVKNGTVDSYDSRIGDYGEDIDGVANTGANGGVATINSNADITLEGSGEIYGNVTSNGSITASNGLDFSGDLTAAIDINLTGNTVLGNIHAGNDLIVDELTVVDSNITVKNEIQGSKNNVKADVNLDKVTYGVSSAIGGTQSDFIVDPDTDFGECDKLGITSVIDDFNTAGTGNVIDFAASIASSGTDLNFTESSLTSGDTTISFPVTLDLSEDSVSSGTSEIFEETETVYIFDAADLTGKDITINGDITIFIQGDITTSGTTFNFATGAASTSSLTILTSGQIAMTSGTNIFPGGTINDDGEVPLTIYSSLNSTDLDSDGNELGPALSVTSNGVLYAKVYAPLGNVSLTGGGNIMGAIRASDVEFNSSAGQIHYDEALSDMSDISDQEAIPASYSSVYYYYPEN